MFSRFFFCLCEWHLINFTVCDFCYHSAQEHVVFHALLLFSIVRDGSMCIHTFVLSQAVVCFGLLLVRAYLYFVCA